MSVKCVLKPPPYLIKILSVLCAGGSIYGSQITSLSPRSANATDRADGWGSFGQKFKIATGRLILSGHYRSIINHCDVIGL